MKLALAALRPPDSGHVARTLDDKVAKARGWRRPVLGTRQKWPGRFRRCAANCTLAIAAAWSPAASAIGSQLVGTVEQLPAEIDRAFPCGSWSTGSSEGHYRVVIASVSGGAGSETYIQRIAAPAGANERELTLVETVAMSRLNDDHSQYSVTSAKCVRRGGSSFAELTADFEHDTARVKHIIRIELKAPYPVTFRRVVRH